MWTSWSIGDDQPADSWRKVEPVLSVDPGKVTGFAIWDELGFESRELPHLEFLEWADVEVVRFSSVVCESFHVTAETLRKTRGEYWSLEQIGCLRYWTHKHGNRFRLQTPGNGKGFGTDTKLKELNWWHGTRGGHANDAARHLLTFLAQEKRYDGEHLDGQRL